MTYWLEYANLYGANLYGSNLESTNLEGANLERANLEYAIGINLYCFRQDADSYNNNYIYITMSIIIYKEIKKENFKSSPEHLILYIFTF